ncbi:MAG: FKBP-type 16 kDa peptidyl-prolyl cis-trans isomerase [Desulfovibrio sp.]
MPAKNGDTVIVHYTGKLADGTIFDSTEGGEALEAPLGEEMLIPGFESALLGMEPGGKKTVTIQPDDAYGERMEDLVLSLPREDAPEHMEPEPGMMVQLSMEDGEEFEAVITEVTEKEIIVDANHPLAGETLTFDIELVEIK